MLGLGSGWGLDPLGSLGTERLRFVGISSIVFAPQERGFYVVNAEGCCTDEQGSIDLLKGYCEHRLAVDLFEKAQEEQGQADENVGEVEVPTVGGDTPSLTELLANALDAETNVVYSNGSYKSS